MTEAIAIEESILFCPCCAEKLRELLIAPVEGTTEHQLFTRISQMLEIFEHLGYAFPHVTGLPDAFEGFIFQFNQLRNRYAEEIVALISAGFDIPNN